MFSFWLRGRMNRKSKTVEKRRGAKPARRWFARPQMEQLETRLTPSLSTLASFFAPNGSAPYAGLVMDSSGNLYGTTKAGGAFGDGAIFEVPQGSSTLATLASFTAANGPNPGSPPPGGALIVDSSGNLYGISSGGGVFNDGTVFELAKGSGTITTLASFNGAGIVNPSAALIIDGSGNLYGTTYRGGASNDGTVFELVEGSGTITTLASFNGANGLNPECALLMDSSGNLYGTTYRGGASNDGTVFELAQGSGTIATLASFNNTNGLYPECTLVMDSSGNLFGTTYLGGASSNGTVFELAQGSGTITTLATFNGSNGGRPLAGLVRDGSGNLFGTTYLGGASGDGTVFELAQGSSTITTLASFNGANGYYPECALVMDSGGNLYGTTGVGPGPGDGTVFEVAQGSGAITTLATFLAPNGETPQAGVIADSSGNLYGTTWYGGASSDGTVFELSQGSGTITTLASFNGANGQGPGGTLLMDSSGNLYGTTSEGGASNDGTVFELAHGSGTITTLASFNGTNGSYPDLGALIMDSSGNLYGTTLDGGVGFTGVSYPESGDGTVFELAHGSGTITTLAFFNGSSPNGGVIRDSSGNLFGTTGGGGACGVGSVFELPHGSSTLTTLASCPATGTIGWNPHCTLVMDSSGNLYGTTTIGAGDAGGGSVFELAHGSGTLTTLASFNGYQGYQAGLIMDSSGNLYGANGGSVFELARGSGTIATLASLNSSAYCSLIMDSSGNLYGTTTQGGAGGEGSVFELTPASTVALVFSGVPTSTTAGSTFTVTVTAEDANGNMTTGYRGTVHFTSSDLKAVLPANYTFTSADNGKHTFTVTLEKAGSQSFTATDTVTSGLSGTASGIVVNPAAAAQFILSAPSSVTSGTAFSVTLTVEDAYGNVVTGYVGTVHFTSSDSSAGLPANYTFTAADAGVHTFVNKTTLKKKGMQTTTVADTKNKDLTATDSIDVL